MKSTAGDIFTLFISETFPILWPDQNLGPFSPQDKRFPLPGRIGTVGKAQKKSVIETLDPETLFKTLPSERHGEVFDQAVQVGLSTTFGLRNLQTFVRLSLNSLQFWKNSKG